MFNSMSIEYDSKLALHYKAFAPNTIQNFLYIPTKLLEFALLLIL